MYPLHCICLLRNSLHSRPPWSWICPTRHTHPIWTGLHTPLSCPTHLFFPSQTNPRTGPPLFHHNLSHTQISPNQKTPPHTLPYYYPYSESPPPHESAPHSHTDHPQTSISGHGTKLFFYCPPSSTLFFHYFYSSSSSCQWCWYLVWALGFRGTLIVRSCLPTIFYISMLCKGHAIKSANVRLSLWRYQLLFIIQW